MSIAARYADLFQMSYITRDLEAAMAHARNYLGVDNFSTSDAELDVLSFGQVRPLKLRAAFANIGRHQLEIIQPIAGAIDVFTDDLDLTRHILNFHHMAIAIRGGVDAWRRLLAEVEASGDPIALLSPIALTDDAKVGFCYVDTRHRIGHYTEYLWVDETIKPIPAMPDLGPFRTIDPLVQLPPM